MIAKMIALDWRATKCYQIELLVLLVVAFGASVITPLMVIPASVFFSMLFSVNAFSVEEKGELNNLYLTLPVKRNSIVAGRYCFSGVLLLFGIVVGIPLMYLASEISLFKWIFGVASPIIVSDTVRAVAVGISFSYLLYALFNLYMFPILFKLGYHKGKFWCYLPLVLLSLVGLLMFIPPKSTRFLSLRLIYFLMHAYKNAPLMCGGMITLGTVLLSLSYIISVKLYSKRDF